MIIPKKIMYAVLIVCFLVTPLTSVEAEHEDLDTDFDVSLVSDSQHKTVIDFEEFEVHHYLEFYTQSNVVSVNGIFYSLESYNDAAEMQVSEGYQKPFIDYITKYNSIDFTMANQYENSCDSVTAALGWGMTGSGCSVSPPTYGYYPHKTTNKPNISYNRSFVIALTGAAVAGLMAFAFKTPEAAKKFAQEVLKVAVTAGIVSSTNQAFQDTIMTDHYTYAHTAVSGANITYVYARSQRTKVSNFAYKSTFWRIKPC